MDPTSPAPILCASQPLPDMAGAAVPDWVKLVPSGVIPTQDARGPYRLDDARAVATASMTLAAGRPLPFDENHASDLAAPQGGASPARGWIVELQGRDDGVWGRVEWTAAGRKMVAERDYRFVSPVIYADKANRVTHVVRASLVAIPNFAGLPSLNAAGFAPPSTEIRMDIDKLRAALGLKAEADEAAILAAATAAKAAADTLATNVSTHAAALASIGEAVGAAKDADAAVVLAAVRAAVDPAKRVPVDQVAQLQSQLATLTRTVAREKAEAFVDAAIVAGKVGVKPLRDHYVARHMVDPDAVKKELDAIPSLHAAGGVRKTAAPEGDALSDDERRILELMGVDPKAYAKTRAELQAKEMV